MMLPDPGGRLSRISAGTASGRRLLDPSELLSSFGIKGVPSTARPSKSRGRVPENVPLSLRN
jgi:hypothetical protein